MLRTCTSLAALALLVPCATARAQETHEPVTVQDGKQVTIDYALTLDDGRTLDSTRGGEPLLYVIGSGQLLQAVDAALRGMKVNESKKIRVPPEQAYGPVDPAKFETVEISKVPERARRPGAELIAQDKDGREVTIRVSEVKDDAIVLDLNHPLAGQSLNFDVKIVAIE